MSDREKIDWERHRVRRWGAGNYIALAPGFIPIVVGQSHRRAKEQAIAIGCMYPLVVRGDKVLMRTEDRKHNCSCHDQFGRPSTSSG